MSHEESPDTLRQALRALPRARPSGGFTERVLERADVRRRSFLPSGGALRRPTAAVLGAATVAAALVAGALALAPPGPRTEPPAERERRARVETLEAERRLLASELDEIRRLASSLREPAPVLYLGGDEEIDLVVDLDRLVRERSPGGAYTTHYRGRRTH